MGSKLKWELCEDCGKRPGIYVEHRGAVLCVICRAKQWAVDPNTCARPDEDVDDEYGYFRARRRLWPQKTARA